MIFSSTFRTNFLDQEWFTFETSGTLIVGWEGGPSRNIELSKKEQKEMRRVLRGSMDDRGHEGLDLADPSERPRTNATGIEIAAALATGICMFQITLCTAIDMVLTIVFI